MYSQYIFAEQKKTNIKHKNILVLSFKRKTIKKRNSQIDYFLLKFISTFSEKLQFFFTYFPCLNNISLLLIFLDVLKLLQSQYEKRNNKKRRSKENLFKRFLVSFRKYPPKPTPSVFNIYFFLYLIYQTPYNYFRNFCYLLTILSDIIPKFLWYAS